jgi:hypothetical protein
MTEEQIKKLAEEILLKHYDRPNQPFTDVQRKANKHYLSAMVEMYKAASINSGGVQYPKGGFAPGNYQCKCCTCGKMFIGDKRAVQCEPCADAKVRLDESQWQPSSKPQSVNKELSEALDGETIYLTKNPETFFRLWLMEVFVEDNRSNTMGTSNKKGTVIGIREDAVMLRIGAVITDWFSFSHSKINFFLKQ